MNFIDKVYSCCMNKFADWLFRPKPMFEKIPARSNWDGVPKPGLEWKEAFDGIQNQIIPMTLEVDPDECPVCNGPLTKYESDFEIVEGDDGQHMVVGLYCAEGHWTHLECA